MYKLRITPLVEEGINRQIKIEWESKDTCQNVTVPFSFDFSRQDQEDLRWYLEDYLQFPHDPATTIATRIEHRLIELGVDLFKAVFQSDADAYKLWMIARLALENICIEVVSSNSNAVDIPWELLREDTKSKPLVLLANSFVRTQLGKELVQVIQNTNEKVRILLVICRPKGKDDIPFRSIATKLLKSLTETSYEAFQLDVLRPPNFDQLEKVLANANSEGKPYHIVHFDGHGEYTDMYGMCLVFESININGKTIGKCLVENKVPLLVLNACRSAYSGTPSQPSQITEENLQNNLSSSKNQIRVFRALAQEVMNTGVTGVVAMRSNVYVMTAAQFVADLYTSLAQGKTLGEAVTFGRRQLAAYPYREIEYRELALQDWLVPIVYETTAFPLFPETTSRISPIFKLPKEADISFFGQDETILALDQAFNNQKIILLYGFAGSGKTTTAKEFAQWYVSTGGLKGKVLFISFEKYLPLSKVLDKFAQLFEEELEDLGIYWSALNDKEQRELVLQKLHEVPVLGIWDNVEPIAGFSDSETQQWSPSEQAELAIFLRDAITGKAKFLLTSRRDEKYWLGNLPVYRIETLPLRLLERVQLAQALATQRGDTLRKVENWFPLLKFTDGNPLTIMVLVNQALHMGLETQQQIEKFVTDLRIGEMAIEDNVDSGRSQSLTASLSYGFKHAFSENELKQIALLYLFQGFVDETTLCWMGDSSKEYYISTLQDITSEVVVTLLNRAAEIGLLFSQGNGYFTIHPALPWYFRDLFNRYYGEEEASVAECSFVRAMDALGGISSIFCEEGYHNRVLPKLESEEANLLHALSLAEKHGRWNELIGSLQALGNLYKHTGRNFEWTRLVDKVAPKFIDFRNKKPIPGREKLWYFVAGYYAQLARELRHFSEAEEWQLALVKELRSQAVNAIVRSPKLDNKESNPKGLFKSLLQSFSRIFQLNTEQFDTEQCNSISTLATALIQLGNAQRAQDKPSCIKSYEEAILICKKLITCPSKLDQISEKRFRIVTSQLAVAAFNLGNAYLDISKIFDLDKAEEWIQLSLDVREKEDSIGQGLCRAKLGCVAYERFRQSKKIHSSKEHLNKYLDKAIKDCKDALELFPIDALEERGTTFNQLGLIHRAANNLTQALAAYRESIKCLEGLGDTYGAALTRYNMALILKEAKLFEDALLYAQAALRNYEECHVTADINEVNILISKIKHDLASKQG